MPRRTTGSPAVQSSSGVMLSYSGMVSCAVTGNGLPSNSLTSFAAMSLYDALGLASRTANARLKMSDTVVGSLIIVGLFLIQYYRLKHAVWSKRQSGFTV